MLVYQRVTRFISLSLLAGMIAERDSDLKELHENLDELLKDFSGVAGILVDDPPG